MPQGAARNCLLVKGGSSFNALVRALKQDLIDSGTAAKDPALLYQIDKVGGRGISSSRTKRVSSDLHSKAGLLFDGRRLQ